MPRFKVAHVREQGVDLIIIPVESSFAHRTLQDQQAVIFELQARASEAGLAGTVVPVWDAGYGRMGYVAIPDWHSFFNSLDLNRVFASVNREIFW